MTLSAAEAVAILQAGLPEGAWMKVSPNDCRLRLRRHSDLRTCPEEIMDAASEITVGVRGEVVKARGRFL